MSARSGKYGAVLINGTAIAYANKWEMEAAVETRKEEDGDAPYEDEREYEKEFESEDDDEDDGHEGFEAEEEADDY